MTVVAEDKRAYHIEWTGRISRQASTTTAHMSVHIRIGNHEDAPQPQRTAWLTHTKRIAQSDELDDQGQEGSHVDDRADAYNSPFSAWCFFAGAYRYLRTTRDAASGEDVSHLCSERLM